MKLTIQKYADFGKQQKKRHRRDLENLSTLKISRNAKLYDTVSRQQRAKILDEIPEGSNFNRYYPNFKSVDPVHLPHKIGLADSKKSKDKLTKESGPNLSCKKFIQASEELDKKV